MSHTPGPWKVRKSLDGDIPIGAPTLPYVAIAVNIDTTANPSAETRANADLIAAAPLLLDAAEDALRLFEEYAIEDEHPQKIAALRNAIKAARGNQ